MAFGCPRCGMVSHNPQDEAAGYCGRCRDWTGDEPIRYGHLPLLDVFELRQLLAALPGPPNSLHTAVAETILNARGERHSRAIQALRALSRMLATMKVSTMPGVPEVDGLKIFATVLQAVERFVLDHGVVEHHRRGDEAQVIDLGELPPGWVLELMGAGLEPPPVRPPPVVPPQ